MNIKRYDVKYRGITHGITGDHMGEATAEQLRKEWKEKNCPRNIHMFDEMKSLYPDTEHVLVCDACGFYVHIAGFETEEEACGRVTAGFNDVYPDVKPTDFVVIHRKAFDAINAKDFSDWVNRDN